jgi:hypothetical protein
VSPQVTSNSGLQEAVYSWLSQSLGSSGVQRGFSELCFPLKHKSVFGRDR